MVGGDLACLARNSVADPFMFATGGHDGAVRVWAAPGRWPHSSYIYPEFTFQSGTPRFRKPSIYPLEDENRFAPMSTEEGLKARELRTSLDELGAQFKKGRS